MIKPVFYILFGLWFSLTFRNAVNAQENLVPNGSFEEYSECPAGPAVQFVYNWFSPSLGKPDFYNACNAESSNYSVPINGMGNIYANNGEGYAAIVVFGFREYLGIKLNQKLENYIN